MIMKLYSVYDAKLGSYMAPFTSRTDGGAIRAFTDEVKREGSVLGAHPEDYRLCRLGYYDEEDGILQVDRCELIFADQL